MSCGHHRPVHPSVPTFPLPSPHWSPQGPIVPPHSEPVYGPGRVLQHQQRGGTPVDPTHALDTAIPVPGVLGSPASVCWALASLQGPTSPRRITSRPLGMLCGEERTQYWGGVLCGLGEDTSCLIHQPPPRLPFLSAVGGARVSRRVCLSLR